LADAVSKVCELPRQSNLELVAKMSKEPEIPQPVQLKIVDDTKWILAKFLEYAPPGAGGTGDRSGMTSKYRSW